MLDRKIAAKLYLDLLFPWETKVKNLEAKGNFDLRVKEFTEFRRSENITFTVKKNSVESDAAITEYLSEKAKSEQVVILAKGGDSSGARSLFRNLRNSVAHANVSKMKISNKKFIIFEGLSHNGKKVLYAKIQESRLREFISAIRSTVKMYNKTNYQR